MAYAPCKFSLRSVATPSRGFHHQFCIKRLQVKQNSSTVLEFFVSYFPSIMHLEISKYHKIISASNKVPTIPPPPPSNPPPPRPLFMSLMSTKTLNYLLIWSRSVWSTRHAFSTVTKAAKWSEQKSSYGESTRELKWRYITVYKKSSDHADWYEKCSREQNKWSAKRRFQLPNNSKACFWIFLEKFLVFSSLISLWKYFLC